MKTKFVEATQSNERGFNWGKFMLGRFELEEWGYRAELPSADAVRLIPSQGWGSEHVLILDLATGEGALFSPPGSARADLNKHKVWVCPMFEPFLAYLYEFVRAGNDAFDLPAVIELPDAPPAIAGYRRAGE